MKAAVGVIGQHGTTAYDVTDKALRLVGRLRKASYALGRCDTLLGAAVGRRRGAVAVRMHNAEFDLTLHIAKLESNQKPRTRKKRVR